MQNYCEYFAARNGYDGFKSYFGEIFDSKDFSRIYVIKGGPGTGKSSMMKRLLKNFSDYSREAIYCSSDPASLDGVIIESGGKKVALLDGTAPHERDAVIPGAIDEIINLGENWDKNWLYAERARILELNNEKKAAYSTAYSYLSLVGNMRRPYGEKTISFPRELLSELCNKAENAFEKKTRLISSFGKSGFYRLSAPFDKGSKFIKLEGEGERAMIFLTRLSEKLSEERISHTVYPLALDDSLTEAIYIPSSGTVLIAYEASDIEYEKIICVDSHFSALSRLNNEKRRVKLKCASEIEAEAVRWFSIASELHFELEAIYSSAMDYKRNDAIFEEKREEILNILKS